MLNSTICSSYQRIITAKSEAALSIVFFFLKQRPLFSGIVISPDIGVFWLLVFFFPCCTYVVWVLIGNVLSRFPDAVKSLYNTPHYNMGFGCNIVCMFCLPIFLPWNWFKLYFICIIYDKYTNNTEYDYNTTTIQMGFRRKSNDLFESVFQEFTLLIYVLSGRNCHSCR